MSATNSPLPWRAEPREGSESWWLFDARGNVVGLLCDARPLTDPPTPESRAEVQANAELVVRLVNAVNKEAAP